MTRDEQFKALHQVIDDCFSLLIIYLVICHWIPYILT